MKKLRPTGIGVAVVALAIVGVMTFVGAGWASLGPEIYTTLLLAGLPGCF